MNNNKLLRSDNVFTDDEIRKVVMNSLASSPTVSSSSSSFPTSSSSYKPSNASIQSCISYLRFKIPSNLPNDYVLDKFTKLMKEYAPDEKINWRSFRQAADTWIISVKSKYPSEYDFEINVNNGETADSPDEGITHEDPDVFHNDFNDSGKSTELVECSILNNSTSKVTKEYSRIDTSIKSLREEDVENTETELLRKRIYQYEKDNAWLREELMKSEETSNHYKQLFYSFRQKYDRRNEEYRLLERENDKKKEIIDNMKKDQKHFQVTQEKWERERKTLIKKIETDKQNSDAYKSKCDKAIKDKEKFSKQLNVFRSKLQNKEDFCSVLQKELTQLKQVLSNQEDYYEKTFTELREQNEDLKRKNFKLELKLNDGKPSNEQLHSVPTAINLDVSFDHSPDAKFNNPSSDSLYDELKASGFLPDVSYENSKIQELEEELDWQDEKARAAIDQVEGLIKYLIERRNVIIDNNNQSYRKPSLKTKYIIILLDKISQLSEAVTDAFKERLTQDVSCQVSENPVENNKSQDIKILRYENLIKLNDSSSSNIKENLLSSNSVVAKINPLTAGNCSDNKEKNTFKKLLGNEARVRKKSSQILTKRRFFPRKNTEWSPIICNTPIMTEKNAPRRKISVFARTSDLDKILESQVSIENFTSSTPVADPIPDQVPLDRNTYRTAEECSSDSSGNLSQLQTSFDENSTNVCCESTFSVANNKVVEFSIAPAKFNFLPSKASSVSGINLATTNSDATQFNLLAIDNKLIESSTPISNDGRSSENTSMQNQKELKNVTWTIKSDNNSVAPKQFYHNCNKCDIYAVNENPAGESAAVTLAMSSGEDSSDSSDSDSAITSDNKDNDNGDSSGSNYKNPQYPRDSLSVNQLSKHVDESLQVLFNPVKINLSNGAKKINDKTFTYKPTAKREILPVMKRSRSESENLGCGHESSLYICDVEKPKPNVNYQEFKLTVFPSLTDFRLQESGIAHLPDTDDLEEKDLVEGELERKYVAFSLGLCTDRLTLSRRKTLSQRRRDQTERNFTNEVTRMQQSIEELAPLCFDSETIDRIERARNQIEIIAQCARKVSCAAETLGAIQQEYRISRAIHLADRYLRMLRSRCEKLDRDLTESKRILTENNIIVDERNGENGEELTVIRYRGLPATNRTMIARRRASIATIFRPIGIGQDVIKDGVKQRNSVTGRVTVRRPSLSVEAQSWQVEKLIRTESSNSVGELHEIFEHIESRRNSREENNNFTPVLINNNNNNYEGNLAISEATESCPLNQEEVAPVSTGQEILQTSRRMSRMLFASANQPMTWRTLIWCIVISFLVGFFMKDVVSVKPYDGPLRWSSFQEFLGRHEKVKNTAALPL